MGKERLVVKVSAINKAEAVAALELLLETIKAKDYTDSVEECVVTPYDYC